MQLFYAPDIEKNKSLPNDEAHHCFKVLRKTGGDVITIIDGLGSLFTCQLEGTSAKKHSLAILEKVTQEERGNFIHIAIAPTKSMDRMEWFVEKAVEIGIDEISFILCDNSERKIIKTDRILKKVISASKQSLKAKFPKVNEIKKYADFVKSNSSEHKLIAHLEDDTVSINSFIGKNALIMIGPEGDFSKDEIELASQNDYVSVSLGSSRLRTETAGIVSCTILNL